MIVLMVMFLLILSGISRSIDTGKIDADYMNGRFEKYLKELDQGSSPSSQLDRAPTEAARIFCMHCSVRKNRSTPTFFFTDVKNGNVFVEEGVRLQDYINDY